MSEVESKWVDKVSDEAKVLADHHWSYVKDLFLEGIPGEELAEEIIEVIGFHYRTAFIHGYGHGQEDAVALTRSVKSMGDAHFERREDI